MWPRPARLVNRTRMVISSGWVSAEEDPAGAPRSGSVPTTYLPSGNVPGLWWSGPVTPTPTAPPASLADEAQVLLGRLVGDPSAQFRDGQLEAVAALVEDGERVLVVQRTGWGKSAVYFVATALLRGPRWRPDADRVAAARPDARPGGRRATGRAARGDDELRERRRVGRRVRRAGGRRGRPAARQPGAAEQPAVPRRAAAAAGRGHRAARRRRGALHQRLGPRLPARLPPHP